jgi:hypothetical protein
MLSRDMTWSRYFQLDAPIAPTVAMSVSTTHSDLHTDYVVRMRETGAERLQEGSKRHPGVGLRTTTLRVVCSVDDGATSQPRPPSAAASLAARIDYPPNWSCPWKGDGGEEAGVVALHSGCPPGQTVAFDAVASYRNAHGVTLYHRRATRV